VVESFYCYLIHTFFPNKNGAAMKATPSDLKYLP